jgi:flagellar hook-length control protein FliK
VGLSATPNAAAKDLGAMLSAGNAPAADKASTVSSGADTFGNLLSDRLTQEAERRRATAQSAADDAGRRADIARKDVARTTAARGDQDAGPVERNPGAQVETTPASSTADVPNAKPAAAKDVDTAAQQAVVDPAAQLAAQIEAARQAAQQAAAAQVPALPTAAPSASDAHADAVTQPAGKQATTDAATLAALNAAASNTQGADTDAAAPAAAPQAAAQAPNDAKANATAVSNAPTAPAAALPDGHALAQTLARTRAVGDNTPPGVRQLGSTSQAQNAGPEHGLPRRNDASTHGAAAPTAASVADVTNRTGGNGASADNAGTQADTSGAGAQFEGILTRAHGDASAAAPTFAVGGAGATGAAAAASITPAQAHALPTFGDAAWPHTMASQLAFMQVHRQSSAELQLNPAELGGLHVKLEVDNGAVNASFVCQHQAVAELVQDAMPRLRDAMHQGGMQLAQTSVSTGDFSQQQGASQGSSAQGNGSGNGGNGSRFGNGGTPKPSDTVAAVPRRVSVHDGAIDTFA